MNFKTFRKILISHIAVLIASIFIFSWLLLVKDYYFSSILVFLTIIFQVYYLIRYFEKSRRKITEFLEGIQSGDFSNSFQIREKDSGFEELNSVFREVFSELKKYRIEKEEGYYYLQSLLQHLKVGILAYTADGKVDMYNLALKRIFSFNHISNLSELEIYENELPNILDSMHNGENRLIKIITGSSIMQLSVYATEFQIGPKNLKLISFYNIYTELEEKEIDAWQKLIRVLTHEIMNSITPISSLACTMNSLLKDNDGNHIKKEDIDDESLENIQLALDTIENRTAGLRRFVGEYRSFTRIPKPDFKLIQLNPLISRIIALLDSKLIDKNINIEFSVSPQDLSVTLDPDLIEQVIINLMLNSIDAVEDKSLGEIIIRASKDDYGNTTISIRDNGKGIPSDMIEKIFIPFFTSKESGTGIGLSFSRQIMNMHKGKILVESKPEDYTLFTLVF